MGTSQQAIMKVVLGAMSFGQKKVAPHCRVTDLETGNLILDVFQTHGHTEIDTARRYGNGTSESMLGDLECQERGLLIGTKHLPTAHANPQAAIPEGWDFDQRYRSDMLRLMLQKSLAELKLQKLHIYYPVPDRSAPSNGIFRSINALYQDGLFVHFGITNLPAWEVAQICELCDSQGWIKPSVYQGKYNALHRAVEPELFPCLRHYGIRFYAFNPVAGGFLAGGESHERNKAGSYGTEEYFAAIEMLDPVIERHGLTLRECALRWVAHHSLLSREKGDAVLMGASSAAHLESNLLDLEKGPLPDEVVEALDRGWERVRGVSWKYWM